MSTMHGGGEGLWQVGRPAPSVASSRWAWAASDHSSRRHSSSPTFLRVLLWQPGCWSMWMRHMSIHVCRRDMGRRFVLITQVSRVVDPRVAADPRFRPDGRCSPARSSRVRTRSRRRYRCRPSTNRPSYLTRYRLAPTQVDPRSQMLMDLLPTLLRWPLRVIGLLIAGPPRPRSAADRRAKSKAMDGVISVSAPTRRSFHALPPLFVDRPPGHTCPSRPAPSPLGMTMAGWGRPDLVRWGSRGTRSRSTGPLC